MKIYRLGLFVGIALILSMWIRLGSANPATILPADDASRIVVLRGTVVKDGVVSGEVVNKSSRTIRDVQLLIRHIWHWKNEFRPGNDTASDAAYYTVKGDIAPGGSIPFTYKTQVPLAPRPDGDFETTVSVGGYAEIIQ